MPVKLLACATSWGVQALSQLPQVAARVPLLVPPHSVGLHPTSAGEYPSTPQVFHKFDFRLRSIYLVRVEAGKLAGKVP